MAEEDRRYTEVYFPEKMVDLKEEVYFALLDIDCNFSKVLQELLPSLLMKSRLILAAGKNYRHYEWNLELKERSRNEEKENKSQSEESS